MSTVGDGETPSTVGMKSQAPSSKEIPRPRAMRPPNNSLALSVFDPCLSAAQNRCRTQNLLNLGRWTLDVGRWTLDVGRWTLDVGRWTLDVGRWALGVGRSDSRIVLNFVLGDSFNME